MDRGRAVDGEGASDRSREGTTRVTSRAATGLLESLAARRGSAVRGQPVQ